METNGLLKKPPRVNLRHQGNHAEEKVTKKIAILGKAPSSRDLAPFDDDSWEIWGLSDMAMPEYPSPIKRWDRWFEMHDLDDGFRRWNQNYVEWIKQDHGKPIYVQENRDDVPSGVAYPRREIFAHFDKYISNQDGDPLHYFTNSISWMIALAIYEGATEIALYGVDMAQHGMGLRSEYAYQRPSVELWLGIAAGRGITVTIPKESDLLKTPHLYGYDSQTNSMRLKYKPRMKDIESGKKKAIEHCSHAKFEIRRMTYHKRYWESRLLGITGTDEESEKQRELVLEKCAQFSAGIQSQKDALRTWTDRQYVLAGSEEDMMYWHQHIFG